MERGRTRSTKLPDETSDPMPPDILRIVPLGGLGEVGMNCLALEQGGDVLLVDCGVTFDDRGLGVDVIHPAFDALEAFRGRIRGIFLTHGHEDHLGAVPHFLKRFDVPIWGPPYSLELLRERAHEHEVLRYAELITVRPREKHVVGPFTIEPIRVTHSTADATALAIQTAAGLVIHTGDFKFDETPPDGELFDVERLRELGDAGVRLLMSDSTNVDVPGPSGSEEGVRSALHRLIAEAEGRVIVGLFASNVHRLRLLGEIAQATGRRIVPLGRSVSTHAKVAGRTGYLAWPDALVHPAERAGELRRDQVLGIATGTQAEANAALGRMSRGDHPLALDAGDHVILSSRVIPGHEPEVGALESAFLRRGILVTTRQIDPGVHVSGHASRQEQSRMIEIVHPRSFIPLHGTRHHLVRHAELAASLGVEDTLVLENGDVGALTEETLVRDGRWTSGRVHLGFGKAVSGETLKERSTLAAEGVVFAAVPVSDGRVVGEIQLVSRGVLGDPELDVVMRAAAREAESAATAEHGSRLDDGMIKEAVRLAVRRVVSRSVGYKAQVVVTLVPVASPVARLAEAR
jgi:ribonuclease J